MNILMICFNRTGHGTYYRAYEFARELIQFNYSVTLMTAAATRRRGITEWMESGIKIVEFPAYFSGGARWGWDPVTITTRLRWLKDKRFDVVHGFESRPTVIYPAWHLKKKGVPLVLDWSDWFGRGGSVEQRSNLLLRTSLRPFETYFENHFRSKVDASTVICSTLFQRAVSLGINKSKVNLILNGFNIPSWKEISRSKARDRFNYQEDDFVIGYVGSLFKVDAKLTGEAFFEVINKLPKAKLLHLGFSSHQIYQSNFECKALTITGKIDENTLSAGLSACDVCWLPLSDIPANWGRFPLKFSTYLTAGKPIIVTEVGDLPDIVKKNQVGFTCAPNAKKLAEATLKLEKDLDSRLLFAKSAKKLSQSPNNSWKARAECLLKIYDEVGYSQ